jgi:ATP-dependent exoDNAse (exonuclease V) beta subunit
MPQNPQKWQSLAFKNRHQRDLSIEFDEPTHKYTVNGTSKNWISCTGFLHAFFPHFDPDSVIDKMMRSPKWSQSKYFGKTKEQIKNEWSESGKEASGSGTAMHLAIEQFHNGAIDEIETSVFQTKEWKYFQNFWKEFGDDLEPYRTEWEVWSEEHKLAGSIDMIYRKKSDNTFVIYDWKRSKEIKTTNTFESGYPPLDHLPNTNYWTYTLQLNVYKWFLETFYGLQVSGLYLVVLHPENSNYRRIHLNIMNDEVQDMLNCRLRALAANNGQSIIIPLPTNHSEEDTNTVDPVEYGLID